MHIKNIYLPGEILFWAGCVLIIKLKHKIFNIIYHNNIE